MATQALGDGLTNLLTVTWRVCFCVAPSFWLQSNVTGAFATPLRRLMAWRQWWPLAIGVAVAPSNRNRVYAIVDAKDGGLYRSDNAGAAWSKASGDPRIWGRGWYFNKIAVDPKNPDIVYVPNTSEIGRAHV